MILKIAHTADAHLDAAATCQGRIVRTHEGRNLRWEDRAACWGSFVAGALERQAELAIVAGDLFETHRPTPAEYVVAAAGLRLLARRMPVIVCADNHGLTQNAFEPHALEPLADEERRILVFTRPARFTLEVAGHPVQIGVLPYPRRSALTALFPDLSAEASHAAINERLARLLQSWRAALDPGLPALLVAHLDVRGARLNARGDTPAAEDIALDPALLEGWTYVALGGIHQRQHVAARAVYPGALDRIDFGEEDYAPGWVLVELDPEGGTATASPVGTPARRFLTLAPGELEGWLATAPAARSMEELPVVRVAGRCTPAEYDALAGLLAQARTLPTFADQIEVVREHRARNEAMQADLDPERALALWAEAQGHADETGALLAAHRRLAEGSR